MSHLNFNNAPPHTTLLVFSVGYKLKVVFIRLGIGRLDLRSFSFLSIFLSPRSAVSYFPYPQPSPFFHPHTCVCHPWNWSRSLRRCGIQNRYTFIYMYVYVQTYVYKCWEPVGIGRYEEKFMIIQSIPIGCKSCEGMKKYRLCHVKNTQRQLQGLNVSNEILLKTKIKYFYTHTKF